MTNKKIFCLEYQNNIPVFVEKKNIKIEPLDVINKFKEKYSKKELIVQQEKILSNLDKKILTIKEVLSVVLIVCMLHFCSFWMHIH